MTKRCIVFSFLRLTIVVEVKPEGFEDGGVDAMGRWTLVITRSDFCVLIIILPFHISGRLSFLCFIDAIDCVFASLPFKVFGVTRGGDFRVLVVIWVYNFVWQRIAVGGRDSFVFSKMRSGSSFISPCFAIAGALVDFLFADCWQRLNDDCWYVTLAFVRLALIRFWRLFKVHACHTANLAALFLVDIDRCVNKCIVAIPSLDIISGNFNVSRLVAWFYLPRPNDSSVFFDRL